MKWHNRFGEFACLFCYYRCSDKQALLQHMALHKDQSIFECVLCHQVFQKQKFLRSHTLIHKVSQDEHFRCKLIVNVPFSFSRFFLQTDPDFLCDVCGKQFMRLESLKTHITGVHQDIRHVKCPRCPKTFTSEHRLSSHLKYIHVGNLKFDCDSIDSTLIHNY